jgi:hypothetical protein
MTCPRGSVRGRALDVLRASRAEFVIMTEWCDSLRRGVGSGYRGLGLGGVVLFLGVSCFGHRFGVLIRRAYIAIQPVSVYRALRMQRLTSGVPYRAVDGVSGGAVCRNCRWGLRGETLIGSAPWWPPDADIEPAGASFLVPELAVFVDRGQGTCIERTAHS